MTAALILAAGAPPGEAVSATDDIGGVSPVKRIIALFRRAGIARIVVVTGHDAEAMERHCSHLGVIFLRSGDYQTGDMLSSVKAGIDYLRGKCSRVFISPADTPLFSVETVRRMEDVGAPAVVPVFNEKPGHPLLLAAELFDGIIAYEGTGGLEGALSADGIQRRFVEAPDSGILADISQNPNEADSLGKAAVRAEARIRLTGDRAFFGPGTLQLLRLTEESGSLKHAARQMGISYSKAIKMVIELDRQLGFPVLASRQGGRRGGGSEITEEGARFIRRYEAFEAECAELVDAAFGRHFGDY